ncbi:PRC-barrel domain-containing protein [Aquabacter spiritensis]|uniref:PRC-barrel domain protein n=1 Tax=Aquabacter spiritensis TaxID=933073 RepID=A0A4R3M374_9HYPH|nr:PRC-barrel domain-containing protein [Aquabacter spiritensis]TCT07620.1 PRC-barrel domain protein [Aquabacter spiritensis]
MYRLALSAATALILAGPAFAQTAAPAPGAPSATGTPSRAPSSAGTSSAQTMAAGAAATGKDSGMTMGTTSTVALRFVNFSSADLMASRLEDLDVYNNQNESIGEIEDFVIKDGKTISGVVVSVGGFLGLGDRYVLVDPSSIVIGNQDGTMRAYVNTSKDELTKAPEFKYDRD